MTRLVLALSLMIPVAALAADPAPPPPKHVPPKAAFDACAKAKQGDACSFKGRMDRDRSGTCETPREGGKALVCRPERHRGSGSAH